MAIVWLISRHHLTLLKLLVVFGLLCPRSLVAECHCGTRCAVPAEGQCPHCPSDKTDSDSPKTCCTPQQPPSAASTTSASPCCCECQPEEADDGDDEEDTDPAPPQAEPRQHHTGAEDTAAGVVTKGCCCRHADSRQAAAAQPGQQLQRLAGCEAGEALAITCPLAPLSSAALTFSGWRSQPPPSVAAPVRALLCKWLE